MNEPLFTLDTGPDGVRRRLADPWTWPVSRMAEGPPPLQSLRIRLLTSTLKIAAEAGRRWLPQRA